MARRAKSEPKLVIRALEPADAEGLARLQAMPGYRFGTLRPPYPTVASVRKILDGLARGRSVCSARSSATGSSGSAGLHRSAGRRRHVAMLGMGVADDVDGRGIGTALLRGAARRRGQMVRHPADRAHCVPRQRRGDPSLRASWLRARRRAARLRLFATAAMSMWSRWRG